MNKDTIGYNLCMYSKGGGCAATWSESMAEVFDMIKSMEPHDGITIVKMPYKSRMARFVITKPTGLKDSGIFTKRNVTDRVMPLGKFDKLKGMEKQ